MVQLNMAGEIIKIWDSSSHAAKELNLNSSGISRTCNGKNKKCGGFKWKFYGENN